MSEPRFSISQISTLQSSFAEDVEAYAAAGVDGIGIWEVKLPPGADAESLALVRESGLEVTNCVPAIPSILPLPLMEGPVDPRERIEAVCASIRRLAAFEPQSIACLTGPCGELDPAEAYRIVVDGLRRIGREAQAAGVRVGLEPIQRIGAEDWTIPTTIPGALELLDEVDDANFGIMFDVWHLWNSASLLDDIREQTGRFTGVHVSDWREPTRGWADRVLPGDGRRGRAGRSSRRSTRPAGAGRTTSRSSPTTAPSGTTTKGRCGASLRRSLPGWVGSRSRRRGRQARRACAFDLRPPGVL